MILGDSTIRGVMQSLMETMNGTLHHAEKSHSFLHYDNVGGANFSFLYYPEFWVKPRPTFSEALYTLGKR